jgi:hypothetical protein
MARKSIRSTNKATSKLANQPRRRTTQSTKPVFGLGTLITVVLFAGLILFEVILNRQKETKAAEATATPGTTFLFDASEGQPTSIEIRSSEGKSTKLVHRTDNVWALELPEQAEANQGTVEQAVTQITALTIVNDVEGAPDIFGLDKPAYTIIVEFAGGKKHTLEVGDATPTNSGYYARLDNGKIRIVGLSGIDALTNLIVSPPYLNTPTPSPLPPTETPAPVESAVTPTP